MSEADDQQKLQTAYFLHQKGDLSEAANLYRQLIKRNPNNFDALHFLGVIEATVGNIKEAKLLMARSLSAQPQNIQFIENYATILFQAGEYESALKICQQGFRLDDSNISLLYVSAISLFKHSKLQESITEFDKLILLQPNHIAALNERGSVLAKMKQYDAASLNIEKVLAINPRYAEAHLNKGNIARELKRYDEALVAYDKALALKADLADAWLGRGNVFYNLKRYDEAIAAYDKALAIKSDLEGAWLGRGNVFYNLKRYDEAIAGYDKALAIKPDYPEAWLGRGNVFYNLKRYDEASAAYDKALSIKPDLAEAWFSRGNVFSALKDPDKAAVAYSETLRINSQYPFAKGNLLHQKMLSCDWKELNKLAGDIENDIIVGERSAEPFGYQAIAHSVQNFKRCAEIYTADSFPRQNPLWRGERYNNPKIRVGYLSGELRDQTVSRLMAELFELHDKNCFELFAFDNGWDDGSEYRRRINKAFDNIYDISRLHDRQVATMIKEKQIDILINLNGYFGEQRTGVFSCRSSPIQVSYLGFSATMGADYIDYIIADRYIIPPEHKAFYAEKVVYLPDTYQVSDSTRQIAALTPSRAELKLPGSGFIFCCFNNNFKITPDIFDIWMRILNEVDHSVLWLFESHSAAQQNLRAEAKRRKITPERLVFSSFTKKSSDYLAKYRIADLFLDTLPFNAGSTANDALWAGLPLLTCSGETYTARMAGSLLNAIGLPELITTTLESYEEAAIDLATHPEKLAVIKRKLAENRLAMPLFDTKLFTKHIEAAYIAMYQRHQAGLPPDHIVISN